jgi:hypothetical protein
MWASRPPPSRASPAIRSIPWTAARRFATALCRCREPRSCVAPEAVPRTAASVPRWRSPRAARVLRRLASAPPLLQGEVHHPAFTRSLVLPSSEIDGCLVGFLHPGHRTRCSHTKARGGPVLRSRCMHRAASYPTIDSLPHTRLRRVRVVNLTKVHARVPRRQGVRERGIGAGVPQLRQSAPVPLTRRYWPFMCAALTFPPPARWVRPRRSAPLVDPPPKAPRSLPPRLPLRLAGGSRGTGCIPTCSLLPARRQKLSTRCRPRRMVSVHIVVRPHPPVPTQRGPYDFRAAREPFLCRPVLACMPRRQRRARPPPPLLVLAVVHSAVAV